MKRVPPRQVQLVAQPIREVVAYLVELVLGLLLAAVDLVADLIAYPVKDAVVVVVFIVVVILVLVVGVGAGVVGVGEEVVAQA